MRTEDNHCTYAMIEEVLLKRYYYIYMVEEIPKRNFRLQEIKKTGRPRTFVKEENVNDIKKILDEDSPIVEFDVIKFCCA